MPYPYRRQIALQQLPQSQFTCLEKAFRQALRSEIFPAASLAVHRDGEYVFSGGWGWLDPEKQRWMVSPDTLFDLASLTKLFTTTAFLQIVSEGVVCLETPLAEILPEFATEPLRAILGEQDPHTLAFIPANAEYHDQRVDARRVNFRQLLTHTAGLPAWRALFMGECERDPKEDEHEERWKRLLPMIWRMPFHSPPGGRVHYSDIGIILLGMALVRLDNSSLPSIIERRISTPLSLASIGFRPRSRGHFPSSIAPTEWDGRWRQRRIWAEVHDENAAALGGVAGHAGLFGKATDLACFGRAWLRGEIGVDALLIAEAVTRQAGDFEEGRGLGWQLKSAQNSPAGNHFHCQSYGHTGFTGTSLWVDPTRGLVVALFTNRVYRGRHEPGIHEFRRRVHDILAD